MEALIIESVVNNNYLDDIECIVGNRDIVNNKDIVNITGIVNIRYLNNKIETVYEAIEIKHKDCVPGTWMEGKDEGL